MTSWLWPASGGFGAKRHIAADNGAIDTHLHRSLCGRALYTDVGAVGWWGTVDRAAAACVEVCARCARKATR